ncbi:TetR family transcriptional regulator [Bacillus sp. RG28]|uniref:TetR family transcriptional regulator n=1 Tax=Gottfriedia endophytica TaxID=2820819 RepID=A0A940NMD2_9BACI|nr:TetR family transcriptional regulator [Gottfriedia endophytica]MBP0725211.1 TetR family transcriptional regulator [Gottfriedia endophytica]
MSPKISEELKEKRKQQILEAAERVFIRLGYEPATLKDIVEETGMSRGWIYLYFQTKEEIFLALMEKFDQGNFQAINELLQNSHKIWPVIETIFTEQKKDFPSITKSMAPALYEYFITGWRDENRRKHLSLRFEKAVDKLEEMMQIGVEKGEFVPTMPLPLLAKIIASHIEGIMVHAMAVGSEKSESESQIDALISYIKLLLGVNSTEQ